MHNIFVTKKRIKVSSWMKKILQKTMNFCQCFFFENELFYQRLIFTDEDSNRHFFTNKNI